MEKENATNNWWNNNNSYTSYSNSQSYSWTHDNIDKKYLRAQEQERNNNSKFTELARSYLAKHQSYDAKLTFDKVFLVYKFNATSQENLINGMENMESLDQANQYFKKAALLIHPDKNSHPLAETVFKKLRQSYETAKSTLKQRQSLYEQQ